MLTEREVMERLRAAVKAAGGLRRFAEQHGFTASYVHDVLNDKRALADRICAAIGVQRAVAYHLVDPVVGSGPPTGAHERVETRGNAEE